MCSVELGSNVSSENVCQSSVSHGESLSMFLLAFELQSPATGRCLVWYSSPGSGEWRVARLGNGVHIRFYESGGGEASDFVGREGKWVGASGASS
jgi:hypothetical protein